MSRPDIKRRTCIGCRGENDKGDMIRLVAAPDGAMVIDYKGNLPGRGAYICPKETCVRDAFLKRRIAREFKVASLNNIEEFIGSLREKVLEKIHSLISLSRKAGKVVDGREAVEKGMGNIKLLLLACDLSSASMKEMKEICARKGIPYHICFSKDDIGADIGKGERGMLGIADESFAALIEKEIGRLRGLGIMASGEK